MLLIPLCFRIRACRLELVDRLLVGWICMRQVLLPQNLADNDTVDTVKLEIHILFFPHTLKLVVVITNYCIRYSVSSVAFTEEKRCKMERS